MANKKRVHILSNNQVSKLFDIPYSTICLWNSRDKDTDWRPRLLSFLASLTKEEIEAIKNRTFKITSTAEQA